jgi:hypothetical protein
MVTTKSILALLSLGLLGTTQAYSRGECQYPTQNPLQGCPQGTLLVGPSAKYTTIQSAILSIPNNTIPYYILILPGNYTEQLNITRSGPLTLLAQTKFPNDNAKNVVNVVWHNATGTPSTGSYDNAYTSTLTIAPTFNSSLTGSGPTGNHVPSDTPFGNTDFRAYNLNFVNDYLPYSAGPSLALSVSYANAGFYYCGFFSYQDTVSFCFDSPYPNFATTCTDDENKGLYRKIGKCVYVQQHYRRTNRLPIWLWHFVDSIFSTLSPWLWWRHNSMERHEYLFSKCLRRIHPRFLRQSCKHLSQYQGKVCFGQTLECRTQIHIREYLSR